MSDKSHVSLEQHVCLVCGARFDTGAILLDKRLRSNGHCPDEPEQAYRTGCLAHLKREAFAQVFNVPIEANLTPANKTTCSTYSSRL
ncbi:hypothetical protein D7Y57_17025 [Stenotrophomonas maltophilia]|nr:hypothetical protein [Stenotrophomonas maltophilia]MDB6430122.1 hypothetical protein [Pseudomonas aeruginosa]